LRNSGIPKFGVYLFVSIIPFFFFSSALTGGCNAVISQGGMVGKIYFPREVLPIAFVTSSFVNMLFSFVIVFGVVFFSGISIKPVALLYLPLVMFIEYLLALGVTFITSSISVYFRDMQNIMSTVSMMWLFFTPLFYSIESVPEQYQKFYRINPLVPIISGYRDILYSGKIPDTLSLFSSLAGSVIFLFIGILVFEHLKRHFAEEV
jgi:ABC-2 type transport system permease protein